MHLPAACFLCHKLVYKLLCNVGVFHVVSIQAGTRKINKGARVDWCLAVAAFPPFDCLVHGPLELGARQEGGGGMPTNRCCPFLCGLAQTRPSEWFLRLF